MVKITLEKSVLLVEDDENQIFEWNHRSFFTILTGYELNDDSNVYIWNDENELSSILRETIEYLEDEGISYEVDEDVADLIQLSIKEEEAYEEAKEHGAETLESSEGKLEPKNWVRQLKPYQKRSLEHLLAVKNSANFSVPGSGKTTVLYAAFDILKHDDVLDKLLVIGPRSCFQPWEDEAVECFGHKIDSVRLTGSKANRLSIYGQSNDFELFLCTYQTATNDIDEIIRLCKRHRIMVVLDESHYIKRLESGIWSEAMLKIAPYAKRRAILTGTPMPNSYEDLWTQITFLWPGKQVLGDRFTYGYRCKEEAHFEKISEDVRPFFIRVSKSDLKLPKPNFKRYKCDLKPYQESIYKAISIKFLRELETQSTERQYLREWRRAKMIRLIQIASNPTLLAKYSEEFDIPALSGYGKSISEIIKEYPHYEVPAKFELGINIVHKLLRKKEKVVIWTTFIHNIKMLEELLKGVKPFVVYGAVPRDDSENIEFNREQQIKDFKECERPAVLIANPAACAESISLHKTCHHALYIDRTYNCGQYMQSLDRIHRIGLTAEEIVTYHILISNNTIDETINRRLEEKRANMYALLEDELPVGSFEIDEEYQMDRSIREQELDFKETIKDLKKVYGGQLPGE